MRFIFLFLSVFLFADMNVNVYVDKNFKIELPKPFIKKEFKYLNKEGFFILSYDKLPLIVENNLSVIAGIGHLKTYIYTHKNLKDIKVIGNANLPVKIMFNVIGDVKYIDSSIEDFKQNKIDAIVLNKKVYIKDAFLYDLDNFGIEFNKFYLVAYKDFLNKYKDAASFLSAYFPKAKTNSSLILTGYYLKRKVNISSIYDDMFKEVVAKKLKVAVTPYWPPFDLEVHGELKGIGIDFWKLIAKKAELDYEIVSEPIWIKILNGIKEKKYDITPNTSSTPDRKKYAIFSKPYVEFPLAIACRNDLDIKSIDDIQSLAVGYHYTAHKMMKQHYPYLNYVPAKSVIDAFELVKNKKAQCVVDVLPTIVWLMNQNNIGSMRIFFKTPFTFKLQVMLRKDLIDVKQKIDKAIDKISVFEKNKIISQYIGEKIYIKEDKFSGWFYFIIFTLILITIFIFIKAKVYKEKSEFDALTQIYNRGTIEKILNKKIKETDGSLIFFDIDHFKNINDNYGHEKGDLVLASLARIIQKNIRSSDYFGRWGGEEFVIILPQAPYEIAYKIAEKLRKIIEQTDFDGLNITISLGVSEFKKGDNPEVVLKKVDEALYEAKNSGRNQVKGKK
ncbi:diguanylate cyclase/phosphodiesterase domain 1 [Nautilia profundicola AmH]|uniref:diguanylate cyclase n=1 Tax=Nautilia profundicola (strain ATCC BAA-1463 / DSM 18972 / AmH) TaxID=598659 RepID=B9L7P4_NAUPA|nr:diguanylate cyclase [Nautilia profundicola]ACM92128.1 diguanylate cyclase/phosphodiesterase domain 1 [Nautilia profundicola AmH]